VMLTEENYRWGKFCLSQPNKQKFLHQNFDAGIFNNHNHHALITLLNRRISSQINNA